MVFIITTINHPSMKACKKSFKINKFNKKFNCKCSISYQYFLFPKHCIEVTSYLTRDKTMGNKFMYIPNKATQNKPSVENN